MFGWFRAWRRRKWARRPFPAEWMPHLERRVPFYEHLEGGEQQRFLDMLKVFVWEKHFIGAGGLEISDEIRVVVAASAVRLVLHLDLEYYDRLTEIIVYPYTYQHPDSDGAILGEAHAWGTVVLSWPAVIKGLSNPRDGHDTAAHEFAHVLDREDGSFDGTPELRARAHYAPWAGVMSEHYRALQRDEAPERSVLRPYGGINEAEFFAVATEVYFEKPALLKERLPDMYEAMQRFYGGDPAQESWLAPRRKRRWGRRWRLR